MPILTVELSLCYYPTSVALVDGNESFLLSLEQLLKIKNPAVNCNIFSNPKDALDYTNGQNGNLAGKNKIDDYQHYDAENYISDILNQSTSIGSCCHCIEEISVIIVDQDIPGIDGIEFCRKIKNPNIKKVLLTGASASRNVIDAFHSKEIHHYLNKADCNIDIELDRVIRRMQQQYFLDISSRVQSCEIDDSVPFFSDPALADYFDSLCNALDVKEYYYQTNPSRFHLKLNDEKEFCLLIYRDEDIERHLTAMKEQSASEALINQTKNKERIPFFPTTDGYFSPGITQLSAYLHTPDIVYGERDYYCAYTGVLDMTTHVPPAIPSDTPIH